MSDGNLFADIPTAATSEIFAELLSGGRFKLERIVSTGQATPPGEWFDQEWTEWVVLISGSAAIAFEDDPGPPHVLQPGDYLNIPAHRRHRVEWTDSTQPAVWLALHYYP